MCVRPTTPIYGYHKFFKEKTVQENEEISKPVLLKSYSYWKKIRKKKSPRTQIGPSDEEKVYLQKKTENTQSEWEKVPWLKWTSHRKARRKKIYVKKKKTNMVTRCMENEFQLLRQCYMTIWTATFAVLRGLIVLIKNWDAFETRPPDRNVLSSYIM